MALYGTAPPRRLFSLRPYRHDIFLQLKAAAESHTSAATSDDFLNEGIPPLTLLIVSPSLPQPFPLEGKDSSGIYDDDDGTDDFCHQDCRI